ncbi:hypothetical protein HRH59_11350 [Rheinheimera sp. YQF-2]|uniref:Uncharacterized protein n=1 Tax=Rheinheimera lutimaris TaxID=2740584 RepID=A0A7Y5ELE8_9GAMM|nr:hypothetical protein [Rheinheimera lutimaris]NRQ43138.1 hypothetical protein [Rheinheimera lutimaris]
MDIVSRDPPIAGKSFHFTVEGGVGITKIRVFVDSSLELQHDCDDPPCHEMTKIPPRTCGATLKIIATDSDGNKTEFEHQIVDLDLGAGGIMEMGN